MAYIGEKSSSCPSLFLSDPVLVTHIFLFLQFLIDMLSFCSFSVDVSEPSDRLSVTLTLLLTAVAFKFVVSQSLPTISYLTLLVSQCFTVSAVMQNGIMWVTISKNAVKHQDIYRSLEWYSEHSGKFKSFY